MNRFQFAKKEVPRLIQRRLEELRKSEPTVPFEKAVREIGREYPDLWADYCRATGADI